METSKSVNRTTKETNIKDITTLLTNPLNSASIGDKTLKLIYENIESLKYFLSSKHLDKTFAKKFITFGQTHNYNYLIYILYLSKENRDYLLGQDKIEFKNGLTPLYHQIYETLGQEYKEELQMLSKKSLFENIIETYFQESPDTVIIKMKTMLGYNENTSENLYLYKALLNFYSLDDKTIESIIVILKNKAPNLNEEFENAKKQAYGSLKTAIKEKLKQSPHLTKTYKRTVYELTGEEFYLMVRSTNCDRSQTENFTYKGGKETSSYSLISNAHLLTFGDPKTSVLLGFNDFDINQIKGIYETDAFSNFEDEDHKRPKRLYSPEKLIKETKGFNEILYNNYNEKKEECRLTPSYVICYDEIKEGDLLVSNYFGNIPLVIINTKSYKKEKTKKPIK